MDRMARTRTLHSAVPQPKTRNLPRPVWIRLALGRYLIRALIFSAIFLPILAIGTLFSLTTVIPDSYAVRDDLWRLKEWTRNKLSRMQPGTSLRSDAARLRLTGALTRDAEVHYRMSLEEERDGNIEKALDEIELGLGIAELHPQDRAHLARFQERRQQLLQKLAAYSPY